MPLCGCQRSRKLRKPQMKWVKNSEILMRQRSARRKKWVDVRIAITFGDLRRNAKQWETAGSAAFSFVIEKQRNLHISLKLCDMVSAMLGFCT